MICKNEANNQKTLKKIKNDLHEYNDTVALLNHNEYKNDGDQDLIAHSESIKERLRTLLKYVEWTNEAKEAFLRGFERRIAVLWLLHFRIGCQEIYYLVQTT